MAAARPHTDLLLNGPKDLAVRAIPGQRVKPNLRDARAAAHVDARKLRAALRQCEQPLIPQPAAAIGGEMGKRRAVPRHVHDGLVGEASASVDGKRVQARAALRDGDEAGVGDGCTSGEVKLTQVGAKLPEDLEGHVGHAAAARDKEGLQRRAAHGEHDSCIIRQRLTARRVEPHQLGAALGNRAHAIIAYSSAANVEAIDRKQLRGARAHGATADALACRDGEPSKLRAPGSDGR